MNNKNLGTNPKEKKTKLSTLDLLIGKKIKEHRLLKNLTLESLAKEIGVTFQQLQKYERGTNRVSAVNLHKIAALLKVSLTEFFLPSYTENIDDSVAALYDQSQTSYQPPISKSLPNIEVELMKNFRQIKLDSDKEKVLAYIKGFIKD